MCAPPREETLGLAIKASLPCYGGLLFDYGTEKRDMCCYLVCHQVNGSDKEFGLSI